MGRSSPSDCWLHTCGERHPSEDRGLGLADGLHASCPEHRRPRKHCSSSRGPERPVPGSSAADREGDRKSTRLNSSHGYISYAVFCLKKKKRDSSTLMNIADI